MDFQYTPEQETYRAEVRSWVHAHLPPDLCVDDARDERIAPDRKTFERRREWQRTMHTAGWVGIAWPKQYGGRGTSLMEQVIFDEEYNRARAPVLPGYSGIALCGPTLMQWGTDEQKQRFLPRILSGEDIWCQGYSEPGAGSDLAGLQTRAVDMGDFSSSTARKYGPRAPSMPTGCSCWCAPTPTLLSITASATCWSI